ncbi:MAG: SDR family oxidoreductase [Candidatus Rokubacteria bacterium]|nr:SDR family oxidoreductase [Candidatus Rokubacteria bacterium]
MSGSPDTALTPPIARDAPGDAGRPSNSRVALVTGGSRGIGRAIALGLADRGYRVAVAARTEAEPPADAPYARHASGTIHDTARRITERGGTAIAIRCDLTSAKDIEALVRTTLDCFGSIDALVLNAGVDCESPVPELDIDVLDRALAINVRAPLLVAKFALPAMIARESGSIVAVSSGAAGGYRPGRVGYSMTKIALERMCLSLAEEVRPHGIAVNALRPGRIDTWMNRRGDWPGTGHIPLEEPDAVVPGALWLVEQTASTFTGQVVDRADFGRTWGPRE